LQQKGCLANTDTATIAGLAENTRRTGIAPIILILSGPVADRETIYNYITIDAVFLKYTISGDFNEQTEGQ